MEVGIIVKALNSNVYTEMYVKNGKIFMNVYDEEGNLVDVMEEVASSVPSAEYKVHQVAKK